MTTEQMRDLLSKYYPSQKWRDKVSKMSDGQVWSIYTRLSLSGKI